MGLWKKKKAEEQEEEKEKEEDKSGQRVGGIMQFGADYRDKLPEEAPSDDQLKKMYSQDLLKYYTQSEKRDTLQQATQNNSEQGQSEYQRQYQAIYGQQGQGRTMSRKPPRIASATRVEKMESDHVQTISERAEDAVTQQDAPHSEPEHEKPPVTEKEKKHGTKKPLIVRPGGRTSAPSMEIPSKEDTHAHEEKSTPEKPQEEPNMRALEEKYLGKKEEPKPAGPSAPIPQNAAESGKSTQEANKPEAGGDVQARLAELMEKLSALKKYLNDVKSKGIDISAAEKLMLLAESFLNTGNLDKAETYINKSKRAGEDLEVRFMMLQS